MPIDPKSGPHNQKKAHTEREVAKKNETELNQEKQRYALETHRQMQLIKENILLSEQEKRAALKEVRKKAEEEIKAGLSPELRAAEHRRKMAEAAAAAEAEQRRKEKLDEEPVKHTEQIKAQKERQKTIVEGINSAGNFDDVTQFMTVKSRVSAIEEQMAKNALKRANVQQPMSAKYRADYIEAINEQLDKIPMKNLDDFVAAQTMLNDILHANPNAPVPTPWRERAEDIQERLNSPEQYAKREHHQEYKQIIQERIAAKITEFETMRESEKLAYIQNQHSLTPTSVAVTPTPRPNMAPAPDTRTAREKRADAAERRQAEAKAAALADKNQPSSKPLLLMNPVPSTENALTASSIAQQVPIPAKPPTTPIAPTPTAPTPLQMTPRAPRPNGAR